MKAIKFFAALFMLFAVSASVNAQELDKASQKALKKQIKELKSEGWKVNPGQLPLETQLTRAFKSQVDGEMITGEGKSTGTVYDAAKTQAITVAKTMLAGQLRTDLTQSLKAELANQESSTGDPISKAEAIVKMQGRSIDQHLTRPKVLMECYRKLPDGKIEVQVTLGIPGDTLDKLTKVAMEQARQADFQKKIDAVE